jgi:surfeit locus 1 family protein
MSPATRRTLMALCLLAGAGFVRLGFWQLGRLDERRASNRVVIAGRAAPVMALTGETLASADSLGERRVRVTGRYDQAHDIVLRGGALQGVPGVYVVTPLRIEGSDTAVLVERGFVPTPDAVTADVRTLAEPGEVTVTGLARRITGGGGRPLKRGDETTWARIDLDALRGRLPYPILAISIRQIPGAGLPSFPRRLDPPPIDEGPHMSYAIQWFLFAAMAVAFAFLVIGRRKRSGGGP